MPNSNARRLSAALSPIHVRAFAMLIMATNYSYMNKQALKALGARTR